MGCPHGAPRVAGWKDWGSDVEEQPGFMVWHGPFLALQGNGAGHGRFVVQGKRGGEGEAPCVGAQVMLCSSCKDKMPNWER